MAAKLYILFVTHCQNWMLYIPQDHQKHFSVMFKVIWKVFVKLEHIQLPDMLAREKNSSVVLDYLK